jgi:hypothetical protein
MPAQAPHPICFYSSDYIKNGTPAFAGVTPILLAAVA